MSEETYTFLRQSADFFQPADVFRVNPNFVEDEKAYESLKKSILGDEMEEDEEGSDDASDDEDEEESDDEEQMEIRDKTETNLINLRRTIYLTIMSSVDFEEAGHKLLKIKLEPGQEVSTVLNLTFVSNVDKSPVDCLVYVVSIVSSYTKPSDSNTCIL
jgi:hypothetical protein